MNYKANSILNKFHPLLQSWFLKKYGNPTEIQEKTWDSIIKGEHVLCIAPTGCGKTLAAFYWALNQLICARWPIGSTHVLYISPLKALNNDIRRNLLNPLNDLGKYFKEHKNTLIPNINVMTRSGDTPSQERQSMLRHPPEILITTPESLNLLITSKRARTTLSSITTVIIDEIHSIAGSKRGTHCITAIDRLVLLTGEFQRIGLSATVKPIQKIADFIGGYIQNSDGDEVSYSKRNVSVKTSTVKKRYSVQVQSPPLSLDKTKKKSQWQWLANYCHQRICINRSTLIFTTNRRFSEKLTRLINEESGKCISYTHHGSLAKELRMLVEQKLKRGELKAIVATSSLEMGIDIGSLDEILLIGAPTSFSSTIQRIGRSGHYVDSVSKGIFLPMFEIDSIRCAVAARAVIEQDIEPVTIPSCPLDICAQIILAMTLVEEWNKNNLYNWLRTSWPFHELTITQFENIIAMLCGKYSDTRIRELSPRLSYDKIDNTLLAKQGIRLLLNSSGGTIPDRGNYTLRHFSTKDKIGELDEEFVWERSTGDTFVLGAQNWKIERITSQYVEVSPSNQGSAMPPFWRADRYGIGFKVAEKTGLFLKECEENRENKDFKNLLIKKYNCVQYSAEAIIGLLNKQRDALQCALPHRYHMVIEHFTDPLNSTDNKQVILHTFWGCSVNAPYAIAFSQAWYEKYKYPLEVFYDDNCIILMLPHSISSAEIIPMVPANDVDKLLRKKLESTGLFGAYFRENAARALLLPKRSFKQRVPLWFNRLRSKKLLESISKYPDFPILSETWRSCLCDEFNLEGLHTILSEIEDGSIDISDSFTNTASPFASNLIWRQTNYYMYLDDTPIQKQPSSLREDIIHELVHSNELRPKLPGNLVKEFQAKLHRTHSGYSPETSRDILDWLKERIIIPRDEWDTLWASMNIDCQKQKNIRDSLILKTEYIKPKNSGVSSWIAKENKSRLQAIIDGTIQIDINNTESTSLIQMIAEWLRYYGPIPPEKIQVTWGLTKHQIDTVLRELVDQQIVIIDCFIEDTDEIMVCDSQNLEKLLHIKSRHQRIKYDARDIDNLPLFLALNQGIINKGNGNNDLKNVLDNLWGFPAQAELWETDILPARLQPYFPLWLDTLFGQSSMIWFGCGKEKTSFCFNEEMELYISCKAPDHSLTSLFPDLRGSYTFWDLESFSKYSSHDITEILWKYTWKSYVSNDQMETLRKGIQHNYKSISASSPKKPGKPIRLNRWKQSRPFTGNWYIIQNRNQKPDILEEVEQNKDRVYQLIDRYGILFRELLKHELPQLQWKVLFKTIRIMELSGELIAGHFFKNLSGLQFMSIRALRRWKEPLPEDAVFWLNACDPASLCGKGIQALKGTLPERKISNHIVYHGKNIVMISKQKGQRIYCQISPDSPHIKRYLSCFVSMVSREWMPEKCVCIKSINDIKA
ncbi:MAG: DEAD/DEAH box helicase, partial [Chitinispirillia bacterium]